MTTRTRHPGRSIARGFSLVELLVTLAVVAILSSLLFPAFATVRGLAMRLMCQNNLRVISAAHMAFEADQGSAGHGATLDSRYVGRFEGLSPDQPQMTFMLSAGDSAGQQAWDGLGQLWSRRYLSEAGVFYCPAHQTTHRFEDYRDGFDRTARSRVPDQAIAGNYQYWANWNTRVLSSQSSTAAQRAAQGEILVTDGLSSRAALNHGPLGCNAARMDGSVSWIGDRARETMIRRLPADATPLDPASQQSVFREMVRALHGSKG